MKTEQQDSKVMIQAPKEMMDSILNEQLNQMEQYIDQEEKKEKKEIQVDELPERKLAKMKVRNLFLVKVGLLGTIYFGSLTGLLLFPYYFNQIFYEKYYLQMRGN